MERFHYIRTWCHECLRYTAQRRFAADESIVGKVECAEHTPPAIAPLDWVTRALALAGKREAD